MFKEQYQVFMKKLEKLVSDKVLNDPTSMDIFIALLDSKAKRAARL